MEQAKAKERATTHVGSRSRRGEVEVEVSRERREVEVSKVARLASVVCQNPMGWVFPLTFNSCIPTLKPTELETLCS